MGFCMVGVDFGIHQRFDLVRVQVARHHHAQVVGGELDHMVVISHHGVFLEDFGFVGRFHIFFNRHQALFAGFLKDLVQHRQQFHVACLGVLAAL